MTANLDKPPSVEAVARPAFDPALPESVVHMVADLADAVPQLLADDSTETLTVSSTEGRFILGKSFKAVVSGVIVSAGTWLAEHLLGQPLAAPDTDLGHRTEQIDTLARSALDLLQTGGATVAAAGACCAVVAVGFQASQNRRMNKALGQARGHYVHPSWLSADAVQLLSRAQQAADTVLCSRLHTQDMEGLGAANRVQLPERIWSIAQSLHRFSRAQAASTRADGADGATTIQELLEGEQVALATVRSALEEQVLALEAYASRAQEVDRIAAERRAVEQVEARSEALMDLVAETAASTLAVGEINPLTEKASAVAASLAEALSAAKDAATAALPPGR
ncbi:hypothetical protein [Streptomyces sp. NRRL S-350]|uniref:hypothetical protein n=1 Tax=Streptomyces sp. NRRL S-350 TaxID=1463902 RepID=UPI0004C01001|nr:hypothetical protein [Streptomyces sp. NRRL S-350]